MARFLYLVQGRGALPRSLDALYSPDSDVIALSWRTPTKSGIFYPFSTFTEGRNRLCAAGLERNGNYLYFIMLDEDAELLLSDRLGGHGQNPWRVFERYLLEYEPAVGVPWYRVWQRKTGAEVDTLFAFDLIVNAIHVEALPVLLPLDDRFDALSWWHSSNEYVLLASLLYPGHILQFNALEVRNRLSLPYPQSLDFTVSNAEVAAFISDPGLRERFKPHPTAIGDPNGQVKKRDRSYQYAETELRQIFDLHAPFWRRKAEIASTMAHRRGGHGWWPRSLAEVGEYLNEQKGPTFAKTVLGPLMFGREMKKRIDRRLGGSGLIAKVRQTLRLAH